MIFLNKITGLSTLPAQGCDTVGDELDKATTMIDDALYAHPKISTTVVVE